ncbi:MAG TPA: molybdopterin oxidoreductase [Anaerolineae bacterium]|nr:molybdopterin oxidoreductase [Anaerolineae bacterium]
MNEQKSAITRRDFLKVSAFLGGSLLLTNQIDRVFARVAASSALAAGAGGYELNKPENIIYSVCLQCHTSCTMKGKIVDGVLVKIDGNPYSPMNMLPQLSMDTSPVEAARVDAKLCPKGQAGVQSQYDPYRIRKVLKRAGKRGENKWVVIDFDQAIDEIVNGGNLFGEGDVPGLKDLYAVRDPELMAALKADAGAVVAGEMTLDEFKTKHADHLDLLIDPDLPDLGPVNNQFVFQAGRIEHGRKEFAKRWLKDAFGSVNWYEHTTICEQSHHIAYAQMTNQYAEGKWTGGKTHMKPDFANAEFVIFFGTGAFEANFGPTPMSELVTWGLTDGNLKIAVVDPRLSKTAAKAKWWVPIQPGTDAAFALGMMRWMFDNERYDADFLGNANKAAAHAAGETSWTGATWLVKMENGEPTTLLRAADLGLDVSAEADPAHYFIVSQDGELAAFDPNDGDNPVMGDLFVEGEANGVAYKSALQLLKELVETRSVEEWAAECGVEPRMMVEIAREFTAHGKKAGAELYRGPVQHTNGYYNAQAIITLNLLVGNPGWVGGLSVGGSHWHEDGSKSGQPFPVKKMHPGKLGSFGITLTKEKTAYEKSLYFQRDGYPAKRPWYPYTSNVYQEIIPAAADGYPYPIKALFIHKGTPTYASPTGNPVIQALADPKVIPLVIGSDIVVAESTMYCDYLFPDTSIWERWGTPHTTPALQQKVSKMRQPMVDPITEKVTVFGEVQPLGMEAVMLAIAEKLGLPGYGPDGFGEGQPFNRREDYYLRLAANLAYGDKEDAADALPEADDAEMDLFRQARRHLPPEVFDEARWKQAVGGDESLWRRVVYLLNRGGRFEAFEKGWNEETVGHPFGKGFNLYVENVYKGKNSLSGEHFSGLPIFEPIKHADGSLVDDGDHDFHLITFKEIFGGQSRTPGNYWSQVGLLPENYVLLNRSDVNRLGLEDGAEVKLVSASNPEGVWDLGNGDKLEVRGKVKGLEGIRPGTVAVSWHYGHWAYGAGDIVVDGQVIPGDGRRAKGLCPNAVMREDAALKNICLTDPIGGSASFYDTKVKVVKV